MNGYKQDIDTENKFSAYASSNVLRNFYVGDRVWIRNYPKGDKGIPGTVAGCTSLVMYQVKSQIGKQHKHVDQLRYKPDDGLDRSIEPNESPSVINDHNVSPGRTEEYHQNLNNSLVSVPPPKLDIVMRHHPLVKLQPLKQNQNATHLTRTLICI